MTFESLYPERYKEAKATPRNQKGALQKSLNNPSIQECFKCWEEADFLEPSKTYRERNGKKDKKGNSTKNKIEVSVYRLNLEPLFYLFEEKYSHINAFSGRGVKEEFTQKEKNILNFFFNSDSFRMMVMQHENSFKSLNFLEEIPKLYISWMYIPYLKSITKKYKKKFLSNKNLYNKVAFPEEILKKIMNYSGEEINSYIKEEFSKLEYAKAIPYFIYDGHFSGKNIPDFAIDEADEFFLVYYSQLKELFPKIMESLDRKMNWMLFLDPDGILWED
ncbi:hypothetical protein COU53_01465 [Candidatus Pacearchaeota archaeon CG10_big_fil_rev_8_21_14_0_10_30_48]|nr:MAG: hypothetical protein COU53_01465 [Candidatus Pacearchaeota archaeon CG10_big_fil_rev_8_21_14_0_10_30_48]